MITQDRSICPFCLRVDVYPSKGRSYQCNSCNHKWQYRPASFIPAGDPTLFCIRCFQYNQQRSNIGYIKGTDRYGCSVCNSSFSYQQYDAKKTELSSGKYSRVNNPQLYCCPDKQVSRKKTTGSALATCCGCNHHWLEVFKPKDEYGLVNYKCPYCFNPNIVEFPRHLNLERNRTRCIYCKVIYEVSFMLEFPNPSCPRCFSVHPIYFHKMAERYECQLCRHSWAASPKSKTAFSNLAARVNEHVRNSPRLYFFPEKFFDEVTFEEVGLWKDLVDNESLVQVYNEEKSEVVVKDDRTYDIMSGECCD